MAHCATLSFTYNALGQRVQKHISSPADDRYYYYDPFGTRAFVRNGTTILEIFSPPVAGKNYTKYQDNVTYFLHTNQLGSTSTVTDQMGSTIRDQLYYPWGQQWSSVGTSKDVRFASLMERDAETALDPTMFRLYTSNAGRWLSPDPVRGNPMTPQSSDRYSYVTNNPTNHKDPEGLDDSCCVSDFGCLPECSQQFTSQSDYCCCGGEPANGPDDCHDRGNGGSSGGSGGCGGDAGSPIVTCTCYLRWGLNRCLTGCSYSCGCTDGTTRKIWGKCSCFDAFGFDSCPETITMINGIPNLVPCGPFQWPKPPRPRGPRPPLPPFPPPPPFPFPVPIPGP